MVQRLFFDRVNGKAAGATIAGHDDLTVQILPDKTQAALVCVHLAKSGAKIALYATVLQSMPIKGFYGIFGNKLSHVFLPVS
jgi:hypothetical protein